MLFFRALAVGVVITCLYGSLAPTAYAQGGDQAEARRLFSEGIELSDQGRWAEALTRFERSLRLVDRAGTQFNVANTLLRLGRAVECRAALGAYLERPEVQQDRQAVADAEQLREVARGQITDLTVYLMPAEATLEVDGRPTETEGAVRTLSLDPGSHAIRASAAGFETQFSEVDLTPGPHSLSLDLSEAGGGQVTEEHVQASPYPAPEQSDGGVFSSPVFWVIVGALLIGGGVAAVLLTTGGEAEPSGGSTGIVLEALSWP